MLTHLSISISMTQSVTSFISNDKTVSENSADQLLPMLASYAGPCLVLIALHISLVCSNRNLINDRTTASAKCRSTVNLFGYFDIWLVACCYYVHRTGDWSERRKWRRERKSTKQKTKTKLEIIKIALLNETELKPVFSFFSAFSVDCCLPPFLPSVSLWSALEIFALPFFVQRTTLVHRHRQRIWIFCREKSV